MEKSGTSPNIPEFEQDGDLIENLVPLPVEHGRPVSDTLEEKLQDYRQHRFHPSGSIPEPTEDSSKPWSSSGTGGKAQRVKEGRQSELSQSNEAPASPSSSTPANDQAVASQEKGTPSLSPTLTHLYSLSHLIFFSILGTLARLGVEAITSYPNAPVISPVLWANFGGCFVMGFLLEDRRVFREEWGKFSSRDDWSFHPSVMESADSEMIQRAHENHGRVKKTIPLFIGLATGFCGSFTSFSSLVRDTFLALSNGLSSFPLDQSSVVSRNGGYSLEACLAIVIVQVAVSMSGLKVGAHLALALDSLTPTIPFSSIRRLFDPCVVFLGFGSWIGAILLSVFPPHREWRGNVTMALVFAPLGCLFRYYISNYLNPRINSFPLGTFVANITGTIVLGACFDLQRTPSIAEEVVSCQVLGGWMEGFSGCATTVSTWIAELNGLERRHGYIYGFTSIATALSFSIVIIGSLQWSRGFQTPVCT